jgi:hypothetical protein
MGRAYAYLVSATVLIATAWPGFRDVERDDFPLSTYPMFSRDRGRVAAVANAVAVDAQGKRHLLAPALIASQESMQAVATLWQAIRGGPRSSARLCETIAARVARDNALAALGPLRIEISEEKVDTLAYLAGNLEPISRKRHARCAVSTSAAGSP